MNLPGKKVWGTDIFRCDMRDIYKSEVGIRHRRNSRNSKNLEILNEEANHMK